MSDNFYSTIPKMSDDEIKEYISNYKIYTFEAIEKAVAELRKRGNIIPEVEVNAMREAIAQRDKAYEKMANEDIIDSDVNAVNDSSAPELFSKKSMLIFSALISPIISSILFTINLYRLGKLKYSTPVILFAIFWFILTIFIIKNKQISPPLYLFNFTGAFVIQYVFWPIFIGNDLKYRKRSVWISSFIAFGLAILLALVMELVRHRPTKSLSPNLALKNIFSMDAIPIILNIIGLVGIILFYFYNNGEVKKKLFPFYIVLGNFASIIALSLGTTSDFEFYCLYVPLIFGSTYLAIHNVIFCTNCGKTVVNYLLSQKYINCPKCGNTL